MEYLDQLARTLVLGDLIAQIIARHGTFELVAHWAQGEFHHDLVLRLAEGCDPRILVVSANCNGGVKELLAFDDAPTRDALWEWRHGARSPEAIRLRGVARTLHWFDPRELLGENARSELKPEYRRRQSRGGWRLRDDAARGPR